MRGDNHVLAVTTTKDKITGDIKPLFHFPIQVCKATEDKEVKFEVAAPSGAKREQVYVDSATGEMVADADCPRGVRVGAEFKPIDPEAIAAINAATKIETMVATGYVELDSAFWCKYGPRVTGEYYIQSPAKGGSPKSYRILYESLRGENGIPRGIVTKRTARTKQKLCVIYADEAQSCLKMIELRFATAVRQPDEQVLAPSIAKVEEKQVNVARKVISGLGDGLAVLDSATDEGQPLKEKLIEQALNGETLTVPTPIAESAESDDLTAMLEASLAAV